MNTLLGKQIIENVDLNEVINRLVHIDRWKEKHAIEACKQYRRYLYLKLKYGHQYELPPSKEIDDAWHAHILHTEDYMKFCNDAFGYYLHHHPHSKKGELSEEQLEALFQNETQRLHKEEFGEYIYSIKPLPITKKLISFFNRLASIRTFLREVEA